jgi:uncharacterized damage-inducible protein DinB
MRCGHRQFPVVVALIAAVAGPATVMAQTGLMADLQADVAQVEQKLVGLANAMPADTYDWRPGEGVRSVGEVFQHVTADNFLLTAPFLEVPAWTNIDASDYGSAQAFERRDIDRAQVIDELQQSFAQIRKAMEMVSDDELGDSVTLFGGTMTTHRLWVLTVTHMHEHLGQAIAYARSNGVVPPWSR